MRSLIALTGVLGLSLGLVACGGEATVDNEGAPSSSIAPLTRESTSETSSKEKGSDKSASSSTSSSHAAEPAPSADGADRGAREIEAPPEQQARPQQEQKFLGTLTNAGIDISTLEDTLIATAQTRCDNGEGSKPLVNAIAGQLVQQHRTDKTPEEIAALIEKTADEAYC